MARGDSGSGARGDWRRRESLPSALVQVAVVAVLLAGGVTYLVHRGQVRQQTDARMKEARALAQRDNPADLDKALVELEALFVLDAKAGDAHALAADVYTRLWLEHGRAEAEAKAREHLMRAEALESRSGERYGARVQHLLATGNTAEADRYLEGLKAQGAKSPKLSLAEARALQARGLLVEARQAFARASEAAWKEPRYAVAQGEALLDEGMYPQALEALRKATSANPEHLRARLTLGLAQLYAGGKRDEVPPLLEDVRTREAELSPMLKARAQVVRAALALAEGNAQKARKAAEEALALNREEHHAHYVLARALAAQKDSGARAAFQEAVALRRTAPLLYLEGARTLRQAGDMEGALGLLDAYETVFRDVKVAHGEQAAVPALDRDDRYWLARGGVLEAAGKADEALAAYDRAVSVQGLGLARARYAKGALLLARKDYTAAQPLLAAVAPEDGTGTLPEAYEAMGDLLFARGEYAPGCQHYYFGLIRARLQGLPREELKQRIQAVERRLATAEQSTMAKSWKAEADALLQ
jgi:tetratricopeptide (TPR) repeat protein